MPYRKKLLTCAISATIVYPLTVIVAGHTYAQQASTAETGIEEVIVWGRSEQLLGRAGSASQGVVGYDDFSTRPLSRVAELIEVVPGMIATQHSGPGKANQYFLRGFNLDHGSDFSTYFDGMPVNFRSHAHAQGYMDLNFIIPEIVERIDFQKGPYFADTGDFSLAGSSFMKTYDRLDEGFTELTLGDEEEIRLVTADSLDLENGVLLYALEHHQTNGHFVLDEDVRKYNGLLKYTGDIASIPSQITATFYDSQWHSTNQIPLRSVVSGQTSRFGFIDPDLGGESSRYSVTGNFELSDWELNFYASKYYMSLINDPTYFLNDPVNGDEFEQEDERWVFGGAAEYEKETELFGLRTIQTVGTQFRYDDVDELNLFSTQAAHRTGSIREDEVEEFSIGAYAQWEVYLSDRLRSTVGVRLDYYDFEVSALQAENSGGDHDSLWQPNIGLAYTLTDNIELYGNYGTGFHSNDVRAAVNRIDPVTGDATAAQDVIVKGEGGEIGLRYDNLDGFNISLAYFELKTDSELVFVGDAGTTEPSDPTRRKGIELSSFWEITEQLVLDFTAAKTDGHFIGLPSNANDIPDAHDEVAGAGLTWVNKGFTSSLRVRYFSDAALTEDKIVSKDSSTIINFGASYKWNNWELGVDILNLLDREDDDIAYYFESQLAHEIAPVDDIHFHPSLPRSFRALLKYTF